MIDEAYKTFLRDMYNDNRTEREEFNETPQSFEEYILSNAEFLLDIFESRQL